MEPLPRARVADRRSLLRNIGAAAIGLSFAGVLLGCKAGRAPLPKVPATGEEPVLNFYNWDTYIGATTLADFKAASGSKVAMTFFANNDELFTNLKEGNLGFDVIVPSDDAMERLIATNLLEPLDHAQIPNFRNIAPEFRNPAFDPSCAFSMPYTWLVSGIGYRKSKIMPAPDSWKVVLDSAQYKGRIALLNEADDMFRLGALYLGEKPDQLSPELIARVEALLTRQKANVKLFHEDNGQELLASGAVDLVIEYNGDMAQAMKEDEDLGFIIPKEGSLFNIDCLAIPKGAKHPKNAHAFINFLLDAEVGRAVAETILYPTPNAAARLLMPDEYKENHTIFPTKEEMARCHDAPFNAATQTLIERAFDRVRMT